MSNDNEKGRIALEKHTSSRAIAEAMIQKYTPPSPQTRAYNTREVDGAAARYGMIVPDQMTMNTVTRTTASNIEDNKNILELFPELRRAMQIYVAALTNPNDLKTIQMFIDSADFPGRVSEVVKPMQESVDASFNVVYNIKKLLPQMVEEIFFLKGSWNAVVLPESTLDYAINGDSLSLQSFGYQQGRFQDLGLLGADSRQRVAKGKSAELTMEEFFSDLPSEAYDPVIGFDDLTFLDSYSRDENGKFLSMKVPIPPSLMLIDNPDILRLPQIAERLSAQRVRKVISDRMFSNNGLVQLSADALGTTYRNEISREQANAIWSKMNIQKQNKVAPVYSLADPSTLSRSSVGFPATMSMPAEALQPIHEPGKPDVHVAYLVQIDEFGYPVRIAEDAAYYKQLEGRLSKISADIAGTNSSNGMASEMIGAAKNMLQGGACNPTDMASFVASFESQMQRYITERLMNGYLGRGVEISASTQFYLSALARTLSNKQTRVLVIPKELVTYAAADYNKYGIGRSLLEATKMISSQRAMLMVQEIMAKIKNSVNYTTLNVTLEDNDRNPVQTVEQAMHAFARVYQSSFPLGETNPMDIIGAYERSAIRLKVEGNNPRFPKMNTDVNVEQRNYQPPDDTITDRYRRDHFMGIGLSPEVVDSSYEAEFAASVITANVMQEKQFTVYREVLTTGLTDHLKKYVRYSPTILTTLRNIVLANIKNIPQGNLRQLFGSDFENGIVRNLNEYQEIQDESQVQDFDLSDEETCKTIADTYVARFVDSLEVRLPDGNARRLEDQMKEYEAYKAAIVAQLDDWLTPDFIATLEGVDEAVLGVIRVCIIGTAMRQWAADHDFNQDFAELFTLDDKSNAVQDWQLSSQTHIDAMAKSLTEFAKHLSNTTKKIEARMAEVPAEPGSAIAGDPSAGAATGGGTDFSGGTSEEVVEPTELVDDNVPPEEGDVVDPDAAADGTGDVV